MSARTASSAAVSRLRYLMLVTVLHIIGDVRAATFTITNNCPYTVWPGILSGAGSSPPSTTGFSLSKGETRSVTVPSSWSGRLWGRTHCSTATDGRFSCLTGDCGSGKVECLGGGAATPATLAEFTLGSSTASSSSMDFYDVSLVDGYNLPMQVTPPPNHGGGARSNCTAAACSADVNSLCPSELRVMTSSDGSGGGGGAVACKSACGAFGTPEYCCRGQFANPNTCHPSTYSQVFKRACPGAYSYAYDDGTSIFTCSGGGAGYGVTFCPSGGTSSSSQNQKAASGAAQTQSYQQQQPPVANTDAGGGIIFYDDFMSTAASSHRPSIVALGLPPLLAALLRRWLGDQV